MNKTAHLETQWLGGRAAHGDPRPHTDDTAIAEAAALTFSQPPRSMTHGLGACDAPPDPQTHAHKHTLLWGGPLTRVRRPNNRQLAPLVACRGPYTPPQCPSNHRPHSGVDYLTQVPVSLPPCVAARRQLLAQTHSPKQRKGAHIEDQVLCQTAARHAGTLAQGPCPARKSITHNVKEEGGAAGVVVMQPTRARPCAMPHSSKLRRGHTTR